jgi:hypothetical protein
MIEVGFNELDRRLKSYLLVEFGVIEVNSHQVAGVKEQTIHALAQPLDLRHCILHCLIF